MGGGNKMSRAKAGLDLSNGLHCLEDVVDLFANNTPGFFKKHLRRFRCIQYGPISIMAEFLITKVSFFKNIKSLYVVGICQLRISDFHALDGIFCREIEQKRSIRNRCKTDSRTP